MGSDRLSSGLNLLDLDVVEHIVEHLPGGRPERLMLLTDCMNAVSGFDRESAGFLQTMQRQGVRLVTAAQALRQLRDA